MEFTLWPACVRTHSFAAQLAAAAAAGFQRLPIGPLTWQRLQAEGISAQDLRLMAADAGVALGHYDGFASWAPCDLPADTPELGRAVFGFSPDDCLRMCDALELPAICTVGVFDPASVDPERLVDAFGAFCERAAAAGLRVDLEFIPFYGIRDLATAWSIVEAAGNSNAAVMVDSWHFYRGRPDLELLANIPAGRIRTVQLADAARSPEAPELLEDCLRFRRLPGSGELDLGQFLDVLAARGDVVSIGPEVFADRLDDLPADTAARLAGEACREVLAGRPRLAPAGMDTNS